MNDLAKQFTNSVQFLIGKFDQMSNLYNLLMLIISPMLSRASPKTAEYRSGFILSI